MEEVGAYSQMVLYGTLLYYEAMTGLCNQLFALFFKLCHVHAAGGGVVFVGSLMTQVRESHSQPIRTILDLKATNARTKTMGVILADYQSYTLRVTHINQGDKAVMPVNTHGDARNFIMAPDAFHDESPCNVTFEVDGFPVTTTVSKPRTTGIVLAPNRLLFNIKPFPKDATFVSFVKALVFHPSIVSPPLHYMHAHVRDTPVQLMHLRTEPDAIAHWCLPVRMAPDEFKRAVEDAYIKALVTHGNPALPLLILSGDVHNRVIEYATSQGYRVILPPKFSPRRELAALGDMVCADACRRIALVIGIEESSFSIVLLMRIARNVAACKGVSYTISMEKLDAPVIEQT
jgi:hypothetical protein